MLTRVEKAQQKWGGSHTVIDKWLNERQELIVLYCKIAGFTPYEKQDQALPEPKLFGSGLMRDIVSSSQGFVATALMLPVPGGRAGPLSAVVAPFGATSAM